MESDWDEIERFVLAFPDTERSTSWGMPGVKTGGTLVAWWRDRKDSPGAVAFKVDRADLEALVADEARRTTRSSTSGSWTPTPSWSAPRRPTPTNCANC